MKRKHAGFGRFPNFKAKKPPKKKARRARAGRALRINAMTRKHNARSPRKGELLPGCIDDLPLFAFAAVRRHEIQTLPLPASVLCRRYGLTPLRARLVAEQAGFRLGQHHD